MRKNILSLIPLVLLVGLVGFIVFSTLAEEETLIITSLEQGQEMDLKQYIGKGKTILHFVAVPCDCCSFTIPYIKQFQQEHPDFHIVTIVFSGKEKEIREKFKEYNVHHPWGVDLDKRLANQYRVLGSPTFVFFNEKGDHIGSFPFVITSAQDLLDQYQKAESQVKR
ncbi:TlpA disulfide reductase family protein [Ammoniphilus sp. CFH 90114]|uniref:TlpA family protein disulfide reductase n=1 Tax=Ammoniphilus sp. CFH 90114 TaxID=2493665 RepID=UPI0013E9163D|nr:TlpA disulfide reductase family protein [Ammoniphilus sp. CFH 90114]